MRDPEIRKLGLLGGLSYNSTIIYYQKINERVKEIRGGQNSAQCLVYSFNFAEIERLGLEGRWHECGVLLEEAAVNLKNSGAEAILLCTVTMHKVSEYIQYRTKLPFLHLVNPVGKAICAAGHKTVAVLGTSFTMEEEFYVKGLQQFGLRTIIPNEIDRQHIDSIIRREMVNGIFTEESRKVYVSIIQKLVDQGATCVNLACTEIGLLVGRGDVDIPIFDTATLHAIASADWSMGEQY